MVCQWDRSRLLATTSSESEVLPGVWPLGQSHTFGRGAQITRRGVIHSISGHGKQPKKGAIATLHATHTAVALEDQGKKTLLQ